MNNKKYIFTLEHASSLLKMLLLLFLAVLGYLILGYAEKQIDKSRFENKSLINKYE